MANADRPSFISESPGNLHGRPVHGGLNFGELASLGLRPEEVLDFSASINPLGPAPSVLEAAQRVNISSYPDPECRDLRQAIASALDVGTGNVLPGNGSTELIHLLARAYLGPEDNAAVFAPTFGEYVAACRTEGVEPSAIAPAPVAAGGDPFRWDLTSAAEQIVELAPSLVFLCNPNNPTGVYLSEGQVRSVSGALHGHDVLVLDEAYICFVDEPWDSRALLSLGNVAVLRSMTKDYALTGLRLGYLLAPEHIVARVRQFQYSWSVNAPAQAAGIAALSDPDHVSAGCAVVREGKEFLREIADSLGIQCPPASANFLLFRVGCASRVREALLREHRICVRDCASFGLPEYIRVGIRTMDDNRRLADALRLVIGGRGAVA